MCRYRRYLCLERQRAKLCQFLGKFTILGVLGNRLLTVINGLLIVNVAVSVIMQPTHTLPHMLTYPHETKTPHPKHHTQCRPTH